MYTIYIALATAGLGLFINYGEANLPRPAWRSEVDAVQAQVEKVSEFSKSTRVLVLGQKFTSLRNDLRWAEEDYAKATSNSDKASRRRAIEIIQNQIFTVENQLRALGSTRGN